MRNPLTSVLRLALALLRAALLAVSAWAIGRQLELSGDLRKFMPPRLGKWRAAQPAAAAAPPQQSSRGTPAAAAAAGKRTAALAFNAWTV